MPLMNLDTIEKAEQNSIEPFEAAEVLQSLLGCLLPADRLVLTLMYFEQCDTSEIAQRMGWSRAAVKMRAYRGRKKIKDIAEREHLLEKLGWIR